MTRWLVIGVVLVLLVVGVHDVGMHFAAVSELNSSASLIADWASANAHVVPQQRFATELAKQAAANGTTVTQYALEANEVHLWAQANVTGSWVTGPYLALSRGVPFSQATKSFYVIKTEKSAVYSR